MVVRVGRPVPPGEHLDPELRAVIEDYVLPPPSATALQAIRAAAPLALELSNAVERSEMVTDDGVPVRLHRPVGHAGPLPAVVTIHGGGLMFGSYDMDSVLLDRWCPKLGIVGISVQYRLAPEHPYPAALDDCYAALRWAHAHAERLGVDPQRIGVHGVSAGGGLAAALALLARDRGEVPIAFQVLDCPMLDDRQTTASIQRDGLYVWTREWNTFGWGSYLGSTHGTHAVPAYAAVARAEDLEGLPPAFVAVGAIDGFRDEDVDYAMRLNGAGVPCELHVVSGLPHGYNLVPEAAAVALVATNMENWLARRLRDLDRLTGDAPVTRR